MGGAGARVEIGRLARGGGGAMWARVNGHAWTLAVTASAQHDPAECPKMCTGGLARCKDSAKSANPSRMANSTSGGGMWRWAYNAP